MAIAHCTYTLGKAYRTHKARRCWSRRIESRVVIVNVIVVRRTLLPFDRIFTNKSSSTTFQSTNPRKGLAAGGGCTTFQSANEKGGGDPVAVSDHVHVDDLFDDRYAPLLGVPALIGSVNENQIYQETAITVRSCSGCH